MAQGRKNNRKPIRELTARDLESAPIWECVRTAKVTPPYEGCARPRSDLDHYDPSIGSGEYLLATRFALADGSELAGFSTPALGGIEHYIGYVQPAITLDTGIVPFWFAFDDEPPSDFAQQYYSLLSRKRSDVFPLEFAATVPIPGPEIARGTLNSFQGLLYEDGGFTFVERT